MCSREWAVASDAQLRPNENAHQLRPIVSAPAQPTTCASAAGNHARPRTILRFLLPRSRRVPPERRSAPVGPVGCMRGLGTAFAMLGRGSGMPHRQASCLPPEAFQLWIIEV
jgi:hypothetical protein